MNRVQDILGIPIGALPTRFLGVPLITKQLTYNDCLPLIESIQSRIHSWKAKHLSYMGRLALIKSVLQGKITYWCATYKLPQRVISRIEQLLARFLWSGDDKRSFHKVSWDDICQSYQNGGLGLHRLSHLNIAYLMRYIWAIASKKDSLWIRWISSKFLNNDSIWTVRQPQACSWCIRSILFARDQAKELVEYCIGDGMNTFLWLDPWIPGYLLIDRMNDHIPARLYSSRTARVSSIWQHNTWQLGNLGHELVLHSAWDSIGSVNTSSNGDRVLWRPSVDGRFSIASACNGISPTNPMVTWHHLVWFKGRIPRYSFVLWLALSRRLPTLDRLSHWGITRSTSCCFCGVDESIEHLFFHCPFSAIIWRKVLDHCLLANPLHHWGDQLRWWEDVMSGNSFIGYIRRIALTASVYFIWRERNDRIFSHVSSSPASVLSSVITRVKSKILQIYGTRPITDTPRNRAVAERWSVQVHFTPVRQD